MARGAKASARTGERINGAYELRELLDSDADCETYLASDTRVGITVQVKLLRPELALQANAVKRFLQAPKSLHGVSHPSLSQVIAIESDATGIPFVVQEHVQGEPLERTVESFPQGMPLGVAINVLCPVVEAVAAAHERGVVHGRLQSSTIVLAGAGGSSTPKVSGFGAPPADSDARSDVWALGALLYRTLSGQSVERPGAKHEPLEDHAPHLPAELLSLVERCLSADPKQRPADAKVLRDALQAARDRLRGTEKKPAPAAAKAVPAGKAVPAAKAMPAAKATPAANATPAVKPAPVARAVPAAMAEPAPSVKPAAKTPASIPTRASSPAAKREPSAPPMMMEPPPLARPAASVRPPARAFSAPPPPMQPPDPAFSFQPPPLPSVPAATPGSAAGRGSPPAAEPKPAARAAQAGALDATVVASRPPAAKAARAQPSGPVQALPSADLDLAFDATFADAPVAADDPEASFATAFTDPPPKLPVPEQPLMTMSDLANAFRPIEGSERVGQGEAEDSSRGRSFRKAFEDERAAATVARRAGRVQRAEPEPAKAKQPEKEKETDRDPAGVLLSRKQLREGVAASAPRALSDEQMRALRERAKDEESRRDRIIAALLFFLFVFLLGYAVPLLVEASHEKAHALLGKHTRLAVAGFSVLSVVALIRTWTMQIHARPIFLRPVTTTLKVVTAFVCVLGATFFLPEGALGPVERAARIGLPWASSFFYFFLAFYGLVRAAREASSNATTALALGMLYMGAFFGSYRVLVTTVFVHKANAANAGGAPKSAVGQFTDLVMHTGEAPKPSPLEGYDAGVDQPLELRKNAGASEADDMNSIDQLEQSRKHKSAQFEKLGQQLQKQPAQ